MSQDGKEYRVTTAQVDDGTICEGYGVNYIVGDQVEVFHHSKYDKIKMRRGRMK